MALFRRGLILAPSHRATIMALQISTKGDALGALLPTGLAALARSRRFVKKPRTSHRGQGAAIPPSVYFLPLTALMLAALGLTLLVASFLVSSSPAAPARLSGTTVSPIRMPAAPLPFDPRTRAAGSRPEELGEGRGVSGYRRHGLAPVIVPQPALPNSDDRIASSLFGPSVPDHLLQPHGCELRTELMQMTIAGHGASANLCLANPPRANQDLTPGGIEGQQPLSAPQCRDIMKVSHCG
jgi:hypothetical protein